MTLSNLSVRTRLILGFAAVLATTVAIGLLGEFELRKMHFAVDSLTHRHWAANQQAILVRDNLQGMSSRLKEYLIADDTSRPPLLAQIAEHSTEVETGLTKLIAIEGGDPESESLLHSIRAGSRAADEIAGSGNDLRAKDSKTRADAIKVFEEQGERLFESTVSSVQELMRFHEAHFDSASLKAEADYIDASRLVYFILVAALLMGTGSAIVLARSIIKPLKQAMGVAKSIREGKLDNVIESGQPATKPASC